MALPSEVVSLATDDVTANESKAAIKNILMGTSIQPICLDTNSVQFGRSYSPLLTHTGQLFRILMIGVSLSAMNMLRIGIIGTVIAAICCFTPALVILLGAVGLSALVGILDYVLIPALVFFLAMTGYALWKRNRHQLN